MELKNIKCSQFKSRLNQFLAVLFLMSTFYIFANSATQLFEFLTPEFLSKYQQSYGDDALDRINEWKALIADNQDENDWNKLHLVNDFFNQNINFINDVHHWGADDYWATPLEFIGTQGGDCEDYSIAKYFTLKALGVDQNKLRLMYVRALEFNEAHMVLIYSEEPTEIPLVLDNIKTKIRPAHKRKDLKPIYSFNGDGLWLAKARGLGKKVKGKGSMALWDDVVSRIEKGEFKQAK